MKKHIIFFVLIFLMSMIIAFLFGKKSIVGKAIVKVGVDLSVKKPPQVPLQELENRIVGAMRTYDYGNFTNAEIDSLDKIVLKMTNEKVDTAGFMDSTAFMNYLLEIDQYLDTTDYSKSMEEKWKNL